MSMHCSLTAPHGTSHQSELGPDLVGARIAVVNGSRHAIGVASRAFARHTLLSLNSRPDAYNDIKRLRPSLVVVFAGPEDAAACELLTLLHLDPQTRHIPVVTLEQDDANPDVDALDGALWCAGRN